MKKFRKQHQRSSSPPDYLPHIGVPIVGGHSSNDDKLARAESISSSSCSSTAGFSSTPPSSLLHMNNHNYHRNVNFKQQSIVADDLSNSSSLSISPSTPRKEWETRFKTVQRQHSDRLDDSSADDSSSNNNHSKYDLPDISINSSSLPHSYILASRNNSSSLKAKTIHGGMTIASNNKFVVPPPHLLPQKQKCVSSTGRIVVTESLDDSRKPIGVGGLLASSKGENNKSEHLPSSLPLKVHTNDDNGVGVDNERNQDDSPHNRLDSSIRGGNLFQSMFQSKKKQKKKDNNANNAMKKTLKNKFIRPKATLNEAAKRRTKSYDCLLDTSMRDGDSSGSGNRRSRSRTNQEQSSSSVRNPINFNSRSSAASSNKFGPVGDVIGPDGVFRQMKSKIDPRKERKLLFTEVRNDAMTKDSATAFLGEEKSTHHGKIFVGQGLLTSEKVLTPVEEESTLAPESSTILNTIKGVESWTEESKNLILPAIIDMCRPIVFEKFHSVGASSEDDSSKIRFGCIKFGSAHVAKQNPKTKALDDELSWKSAHFELRQNYLLEYKDDVDVLRRPCGYAFLQGAVVRRHENFEHTLNLEFKQHQSKSTRCTVLIRLKSLIETERWLWCLSQAAKLKIEDLFQYDSSKMGKELGRGRYASIRPGRRQGKSKAMSSFQQSFAVSGGGSGGEDGILKKKPSFSSFSNLSLSEEEYECALKIVDKNLFWKNVKQGNERADSLVRETCVQAALIAQAKEHKGFLRLKSFFETEDKVVLELELLGGTDLYQYIKKKQPLSELEASKIMYDILKCIDVMNNLGIAHRDLKPANILMANKSNRYGTHVNVGDFGNATFVGKDNLVRGRCGTVGYVAPEIFLAGKNIGYENKVDEFSAGVILYLLLCGYEPFYGETEKELIEVNKRAVVEFPEEDWLSISVEGRDLVEKLLTKDPSKRISAKKALGHPWITRRALRMQNPIPQEDQNDQTEDVNNCACTIS